MVECGGEGWKDVGGVEECGGWGKCVEGGLVCEWGR